VKTTASVALLPQLLPPDWHARPTLAVVIDTLRFTSTASQALAAGAADVEVVSDIDTARRVAERRGERALLCGERHCRRIPGFHLGNSPLEYTPERVAGRPLIFSTTNGTLAVEAVAATDMVLLGSLLNRQAVSQRVRTATAPALGSGPGRHVWIVCAGTDGEVALEDVLTAGAILDSLLNSDAPILLGNDSAWLAWGAWQELVRQSSTRPGFRLAAREAPQPEVQATEVQATESHSRTGMPAPSPAWLAEAMELGSGGRNLIAAGFASDLLAVSQLDSLAVVPIRETSAAGGVFVKHLEP
jgi:2-phosphosulfolactate phosphatase